MPAAPLPPDERRRLENLEDYAILDTLPEQQFDDLTLLAAQICGTPMSLISLIDSERQWFKSHFGLETSETPRSASFCAHAILSESVMEVPDATLDERFAHNILVTGAPEIRYYAGAPLVSPAGFRLGTLCVLDKKPRHLLPSQLQALEALARQTVAQLELMRTVRRFEAVDGARSQAMSHLSANAALMRQFLEHAPAAIAMLDRDLRFVVVSNRFLSDYHLVERNVVGLYYRDVFPHFPSRWKEICPRVLCGAIERNEAEEFVQSDGQTGFLQWDARPWRDAHGKIAGIILLTELISERVRAQRIKNEFVSVVSHELRTPLTSIRGALGLLAGGMAGELPPGAQQMIEIAQKNSDRLVLLINDILDIEKIESGKMRFERKPIKLMTLLQSALEANRNYAQILDVSLELQREDNCPVEAEVFGDENRLQQVLSNLLSNACKFTPSGGTVTLRAHIESASEASNFGAEQAGAEQAGAEQLRSGAVQISVIDEGPGVPAEFVPRLFEKFAQADSSSTRKQGGTGLGLAIARAIVEKHGGALNYRAPQKINQGATFQFDLPLFQESESPSGEAW
ncbi:PAS domain S-box-containing protein [Abditibacterium utsteinense]|uniref:histidine kinase n=1 Tax=Abditibacterium utsteinense TaxID=1960156 RepID=A0A2S8SWF4_9BACT|nr:ATP-binding protein [Abditibacterium utsteinense]PQV65089.1 PAS domain S-box-containing protein [Abditibacterium utsteinense]